MFVRGRKEPVGERAAASIGTSAGIPLPSVIGTATPHVDALDKGRGDAEYVDDVRLPGMLQGAAARSPHAHARVVSVHTTRAARLPGAKAVVTGADTAHRKGSAFRPHLYPLARMVAEHARRVLRQAARRSTEDLDRFCSERNAS